MFTFTFANSCVALLRSASFLDIQRSHGVGHFWCIPSLLWSSGEIGNELTDSSQIKFEDRTPCGWKTLDEVFRMYDDAKWVLKAKNNYYKSNFKRHQEVAWKGSNQWFQQYEHAIKIFGIN